MTLRDDMIFRPTLGPQQKPTARARAREDRRLDRANRKGGVLRRLRLLRQMRRRQMRLRSAASGQRATQIARLGRAGLARGASGLAGKAVQKGGQMLARHPVGAIALALIAGGIVALRLGSGKTFEQMGDEMNNMILGDMDEAARAKMSVRHRFQADPLMARIRSQSGKQNMQMNRIAQDLFRVEKQYEDGKALIEREFGVNNTFDMLILRAQQAFQKAWKAEGGDDLMERFIKKAVRSQMRDGNKRMGR